MDFDTSYKLSTGILHFIWSMFALNVLNPGKKSIEEWSSSERNVNILSFVDIDFHSFHNFILWSFDFMGLGITFKFLIGM